MRCVRTTDDHAVLVRAHHGSLFAMLRPRSPASLAAKGSTNSRSERADSIARWAATHRAVSQTSGSEVAEVNLAMTHLLQADRGSVSVARGARRENADS